MNRSRKILTFSVAAIAAFVIPTVAYAHTSTPSTVSATTHLTNRPDSGGNGDWALDTMTRTVTITKTGFQSGIYSFTATVNDRGGFATIASAFAPNQGAPYTGMTLPATTEHGTVTGYAQFSFTADHLPQAHFVPSHVDGAVASTSTWYELAFPSGTVFGGAGIGHWIWGYHQHSTTLIGSTHFDTTQYWVDADTNSGGQIPTAGEILG